MADQRFKAMIFGATWQIEDTHKGNAVVCGGPSARNAIEGMRLGQCLFTASRCPTPGCVLKIMEGWIPKQPERDNFRENIADKG